MATVPEREAFGISLASSLSESVNAFWLAQLAPVYRVGRSGSIPNTGPTLRS